MSKVRIGSKVEWDWGKGTATGKILESFTEPVECTIKGSKIKRHADAENPAYLIEQDDGARVLKGHSELRKAT